ncbi:MAG: hypothetical protein IT343_14340 [Candidatus Melainabacteria bacterium]|jgi:hypothetical protein|nr:hypothetical protein [Candidatus Melainabacteria bacterium]
MTAILSLGPVVAACYLLATLKGHAVLLLFLAASLAWCAWAVMRERRCSQLERLARRAEIERMMELDREAEEVAPPSPVVSHPPAELPGFLVACHSASRRPAPSYAMSAAGDLSAPVLQDTWRQAPGADRVRAFPIHKLSR